MDYNEFQERFGEVKEDKCLNGMLNRCQMYDPDNINSKEDAICLLSGHFYNIGYFRAGLDPREVIVDWEVHLANLGLAFRFSKMLKGTLLHSDIDSPYYPFVMYVDQRAGDFQDDFKLAIGLNVSEGFIALVGDVVIEDKADARSVFWASDIDGEIEEYLSEDEVEMYCQVTAAMRGKLANLRYIRFPWEYNRYPVFFVGEGLNDSLIGLTAFRVDK